LLSVGQRLSILLLRVEQCCQSVVIVRVSSHATELIYVVLRIAVIPADDRDLRSKIEKETILSASTQAALDYFFGLTVVTEAHQATRKAKAVFHRASERQACVMLRALPDGRPEALPVDGVKGREPENFSGDRRGGIPQGICPAFRFGNLLNDWGYINKSL
jgi:hypothetical protein